MFVMNCLFEHSGEKKVVYMSGADISHVYSAEKLTDDLLHYFAGLMRKRESSFKLIVGDDPNRKQMNQEDQLKYAAMFNKRISEELEAVQGGLLDDRGQIQRKLGRLMKEGKIDAAALLAEEQIVQARLGES